MRKFLLIVFFGFAFQFCFAQSQQLFKNNDRICFIGNSITNNGEFHTNIFLYYATRFPDVNLNFYNCGISGDVASGVLSRMESDILVHKPTVAVVMIGMNDVNRKLYAQKNVGDTAVDRLKAVALENYRKNTRQLAEVLKRYGCRIIIQTPSIYDQTAKIPAESLFGVNDALGECGNYLKTIAPEYNAPVVDYWSLMKKINEEEQKKDSAYTLTSHDRVHPLSPGHFVMAYQFLKSTGAPAYVSKTVIDAKNYKVVEAVNTDITLSKAGKNEVIFNSLEKSLPYPVKKEAFPALALVPFTNDLNQELLVINNLSGGNYELLIDNIKVGIYKSEELNNGINLALNEQTPQYLQAVQVMNLCEEYRQVYSNLRQMAYVEYKQIFDYAYKTNNDSLIGYITKKIEKQGNAYVKGALEKYLINKPKEKEFIDKLTEIRNQVYSINRPKNHKFILVKI